MLTHRIRQLFEAFANLISALILLFIIIGIAIGAVQLTGDLWVLLRMEGITGKYIDLIANVLTLYVLVELARSLIEYFHTQTLRLTFIVDAAIIFVIREILIGLFKHDLKADMIYALSMLILVLGLLRIGSAWLYLKKKATGES